MTDADLAATSLPDPGRGGVVARFLRGASYVFGALPYLLGRPRLLRLLVLPLLLNLVLFVGLVATALYFTLDVASWLWSRPEGWLVALWYLSVVLVGIALVAVSYAVFMVLASLLGSTFYERLSERTEELELGRAVASEPLTVGGMARGVGEELGDAGRSLLGILFVSLPLFVLNFVPVIGSLLYAAVNASMAGYTAALEGISSPAERRELGRAERQATLRANLALCMGFGAASGVLLLVPLLNLAILPLTVVGGTRMFLHLEAHGRTVRRGGARAGARSSEGTRS